MQTTANQISKKKSSAQVNPEQNLFHKTDFVLCRLNNVLGDFSGYQVCTVDETRGDMEPTAGETYRLQVAQAKQFCDGVRQSRATLDNAKLQYLMGLFDLSVAKLTFETGVPDYRIIDILHGSVKPTEAEEYELCDYIYELAEDFE